MKLNEQKKNPWNMKYLWKCENWQGTENVLTSFGCQIKLTEAVSSYCISKNIYIFHLSNI